MNADIMTPVKPPRERSLGTPGGSRKGNVVIYTARFKGIVPHPGLLNQILDACS